MGEERGGILARMGSDLKGKWGVEFGHDLCLVMSEHNHRLA